MNPPEVSVIIPVYNRERFLGEALDSVLAQTYTDFEILVGDDASTDLSLQVAKAYERAWPTKVKVLESRENHGIAPTVNRLLDAARGRYFARLDSDDVWLPRKLEVQVAYMESHPDVDFCIHDVEFFDSESGRVLGDVSALIGKGKLRGGDVRRLFEPYAGSAPSHMFRVSAVDGARYNEVLHEAHELLFEVEVLAKGGKLGVINQRLARYRRHSGNRSRDPQIVRRKLEHKLMALAMIEARYPHLFTHSLRRKRDLLTVEMVRAIMAGDYVHARRLAGNAWRGGLGPKLAVLFLAYRLVYTRPALRDFVKSSRIAKRLERFVYGR